MGAEAAKMKRKMGKAEDLTELLIQKGVKFIRKERRKCEELHTLDVRRSITAEPKPMN